MAEKKRRRRLKKKVKRTLWASLFTIIAVVVAVVAINYVDFSKSAKDAVTLQQFLADMNHDMSVQIECRVIQFERGAVVGDTYCSDNVKQRLMEEEYSGDCLRLLIPQGKASVMEVYAVVRKGSRYVVDYELR